jgi:hypothetical protein
MALNVRYTKTVLHEYPLATAEASALRALITAGWLTTAWELMAYIHPELDDGSNLIPEWFTTTHIGNDFVQAPRRETVEVNIHCNVGQLEALSNMYRASTVYGQNFVLFIKDIRTLMQTDLREAKYIAEAAKNDAIIL